MGGQRVLHGWTGGRLALLFRFTFLWLLYLWISLQWSRDCWHTLFSSQKVVSKNGCLNVHPINHHIDLFDVSNSYPSSEINLPNNFKFNILKYYIFSSKEVHMSLLKIGSVALLLCNTLKWSAILGLSFFSWCMWPRESMIRGSSALSEFCSSLLNVLTLWYCVEVKQYYHSRRSTHSASLC